jgi:MerR family transcriptional regulator, light-induced transcriptional regulator
MTAPPLGVRIGELSRRVGVAPETLRAWERRYGVLSPARTDAGYRIYGRDDELRALRMRELIDGGWAAGEAANAVTEPVVPIAPVPSAAATRELLGALLHFDAAEAHAVIDRLLATRSLDGSLRDVVLPVLHEIGERWARGEIGVAQEHYAAELLAGRLRGLAREWDDGLGPRAVLACPSAERHDIGLLCCGLALHRRGWRITYLGADTPVQALASTVSRLSPSLVVIGVLQPDLLSAVTPELAQLADEVAIAVGGAGATPGLAAAARARLLSTDPVTAAGELSRGRA